MNPIDTSDLALTNAGTRELALGLQPPELRQEVLAEIVGLTRNIFSGSVQVEESFDPDFPAERWSVIKVETQGTPRSILDREIEWHRRVEAVLPDAIARLRLSIFPQ